MLSIYWTQENAGQEAPRELFKPDEDVQARRALKDLAAAVRTGSEPAGATTGLPEFLAAEITALRFALSHKAETVALTKQITQEKPEDPRAAFVFDDTGCLMLDSMAQFLVSIMAVYPSAEVIASVHIIVLRPPNRVAGDAKLQRRTLQRCQGLADFKSQLCVEAEGAVVISRLHKPYPSEMFLSGMLEHVLHQASAHRTVLRVWRDRKRANTSNGRVLP